MSTHQLARVARVDVPNTSDGTIPQARLNGSSGGQAGVLARWGGAEPRLTHGSKCSKKLT